MSITLLLVGCGQNVESSKESVESFSPSTTHPTESSTTSPTNLYDVSDIDVSHIDSSNRLICFTFDDGPNVSTSLSLLKVFENFNKTNPDYEAHGSFFYIGNNVKDETKEIIKEAQKQHFQIGTHSESHQNLTEMDNEKIKYELETPLLKLKQYIDISNALIRPPFGKTNDTVLNMMNVPFINWTTNPDLDSLDWDNQSTDQIYSKVYQNAVDGGIVLMHEGYQTTIQAVKRLLPDLKEKGFQVVTIDEYIKVRGLSISNNHVYDSFCDI